VDLQLAFVDLRVTILSGSRGSIGPCVGEIEGAGAPVSSLFGGGGPPASGFESFNLKLLGCSDESVTTVFLICFLEIGKLNLARFPECLAAFINYLLILIKSRVFSSGDVCV
jgi:hypothetical protein